MKPRWPRALRVLTEEERQHVRLLRLACSAADCTKCDWRGPLRQDHDEAGRDGIQHLVDGCR